MDPISQGALGAIAAASAAPAKQVRLATFVGWAAGMLADADIFIRSESDPLLNIEYHRHFTHSLVFIPFGALVAAAVFWLLFLKRKSFGTFYLYSFLGYATAGLLDACTSYGTRLLWPFSDARVAWNVISIIDPVFTGTILLLIVWGFWKRRVGASRAACGFAVAYLLFGAFQNWRANEALLELAESRGHGTASRFTAKPSIGNLALWRGIYEYDGFIYVDAIRVSYWGAATKVYQGTRVEKMDASALLGQLPEGSALAADVTRFEHFSDGYLSLHPERAEVVSDARYAMLPDSIEPLWGIEVDPSKPDEHAAFINFRNTRPGEFERLWNMITGKE